MYLHIKLYSLKWAGEGGHTRRLGNGVTIGEGFTKGSYPGLVGGGSRQTSKGCHSQKVYKVVTLSVVTAGAMGHSKAQWTSSTQPRRSLRLDQTLTNFAERLRIRYYP